MYRAFCGQPTELEKEALAADRPSRQLCQSWLRAP